MIIANNLFKSFSEKVIFNGLSFHLKNTGLYAVSGVSGIGKTTLLRIIAGLDTADAGELVVNGKISYVFQENRLFPWLNLNQNMLLITKEQEKVDEMLMLFSLEKEKALLPSQMSGGMLRRAEIVRAFVADFDILLLDEPFSGLDDYNAEKVAQLIFDTSQNKCILYVSHEQKIEEKFITTTIQI